MQEGNSNKHVCGLISPLFFFIVFLAASLSYATNAPNTRGGDVDNNQGGRSTSCSYEDYKGAVSTKESGQDYRSATSTPSSACNNFIGNGQTGQRCVNYAGYLGFWQLGGDIAEGQGNYNTKRGLESNNGWPSRSDQEILNDPALQEQYFDALVKDNQNQIMTRGLDAYIGQTINGFVVTESGILAAMHLKGPAAVEKFLDSGGAVDGTDGNGTALSSYMAEYGGFDIPGGPSISAGDGCKFVPEVQNARPTGGPSPGGPSAPPTVNINPLSPQAPPSMGCVRFCDLPDGSMGVRPVMAIPSVPPPPPSPDYNNYRICDGGCPGISESAAMAEYDARNCAAHGGSPPHCWWW